MGYVQVPPDGAGKKILTKTHSVAGQTVQAQIIHTADPVAPDNIMRVDKHGAASMTFSEGQPILAGFGALKVASEHPLAVYESSIGPGYSSLFSSTKVGTGDIRYAASESSNVLSVGGDANARITHRSNRYHYYCPGSSNVFKMTTACGDSGKVGNTRRWGAYDDRDGIFFELAGTTLGIGIRSSTTGAVVETIVPRASWTGDKLDGTGLSGVDLDITKIQVWWMDYQWLGSGRARFGVYGEDGSRIVCHEQANANRNTLPYMRTGTLPATVEIFNTTATGSTSELRAVCIGVYTETDFNDFTYWHHSDVEASKTVTTNTPLLSIRPKATVSGNHNSASIFPVQLNVYSTQPAKLTFYATSTAPTDGTWSPAASMIESNVDCTAVDLTNAQAVHTVYVAAGVSSISFADLYEANSDGLCMHSNGTYNYWTVVCTKLGTSTTTVTATLNYKELW